MKQFSNKIYILIPVFYFLIFGVANAQSLFFKSSRTSYRAGDTFTAQLFIDTGGQQINTLQGQIDFSSDKVNVSEVRYGNSIISLWVQTPKIDYSKGTIDFAGGVPGGYSGSAGPILTLILRAREAGTAKIFLQNFKVLLNDGQGTELKNVAAPVLVLNLKEALPAVAAPSTKSKEIVAEIPLPDTVPPEEFIPLVSRHPLVAGNRYFVSFSAVDKDSGTAYYEVREAPLILNLISRKFGGEWVRAESPYILQWQEWPTEVLVRAYDQAGNFREEKAYKPIGPTLLVILIAVLMFLVILVFFLIKRKNVKIKARVK